MSKKACDLLLVNGSILNENYEIAEDQAIVIADGVIAEIGDTKEIKERYTGEEIVGKGKLWIPGLTDSHMHTGQQLLRGKILDELPMIWTRIMLPFESTLTPEKMKLSAELAALEMITSGTTSFVDAGGYFMEEAAMVYEKSGLRGVLSCSTMDAKNLPESIAMNACEAILQTDRLYDAFHERGNLKVYYSLRSLISCSEELMSMAAERAGERKTFLQAHMNEYPNEVNFFLERFQMRPLEYMERKGYLNIDFLSAHSLLLSEEEKDILAEKHAKVVHCPFSNCGKAVPDTPSLLKRGIPVSLGTDGTAHGGMNLFQEMKIFRSIMNAEYGVKLAKPDIMPARQILKMVLEGGAEAVNERGTIGKIKEGYKADLISIDIQKPHLYPTNNLVNTLIESVQAQDVEDMIVNGKVLMEKREIKTLDMERIYDFVQRILE